MSKNIVEIRLTKKVIITQYRINYESVLQFSKLPLVTSIQPVRKELRNEFMAGDLRLYRKRIKPLNNSNSLEVVGKTNGHQTLDGIHIHPTIRIEFIR